MDFGSSDGWMDRLELLLPYMENTQIKSSAELYRNPASIQTTACNAAMGLHWSHETEVHMCLWDRGEGRMEDGGLAGALTEKNEAS